MDDEAQFEVFTRILRRFEREGVLQHVMLIGSWCLRIYRSALTGARSLPAMRTLDADFLIPNQRLIKRDVDVPALLQEMGFTQTLYSTSSWVVYDHPELRGRVPHPGVG